MKNKPGSALEVLGAFTKLGCTSFGGPVAHLGYFREEFVQRREWLDDQRYADLVALCQFLPGPASSQVGMALGKLRAGWLGALCAFVGFTLPSAILMIAFAYGAALTSGPVGEGVLTGLKIVAVAIVAQALLGMTKTLTPDRTRALIAVSALALVLLVQQPFMQVAVIALGAIAGLIWCRAESSQSATASSSRERHVGITLLILFGLLLVGLPIMVAATGSALLDLVESCYRSGALVFGGGHVVLPLLQGAFVESGWVSGEQFLAGYGAAQAVPGPLFTFAAYLGVIADGGPGGIAGATLALLAIFLPGALLLFGALPFWETLRAQPQAQAALRGANAAVVGILGAALYDPVFTTAVTSPAAFVLAITCFVLLISLRTPPWAVVLVGAAGGVLISLLG